MTLFDEQTHDRLAVVRDRPAGPQGPCAALAWAVSLYLLERYHPLIGLDVYPSGRPVPGQADWYGPGLMAPARSGLANPPRTIVRFWDAAVFTDGAPGNDWTDLGRRFLEGEIEAPELCRAARRHAGLPEPQTLARPTGRPRWIWYLILLRAAVDLLVHGNPVGLTRGLEWPALLPADEREPHPLRRAGVLGVRDAGAAEWIGLAASGRVIFVHRRDARLIERRAEWTVTPGSDWLPEAGWEVGRYLWGRLTG